MGKKRYTLYLSRPLARRFDDLARLRKGAKSALVEEALTLSLAPEAASGAETAAIQRHDTLMKAVRTIERDVAIVTEVISLYVRYFLTITPPLPSAEQEPARLLGKERFQVFVAQVGRRLASDRRLVSEVLEAIAEQHPDLFATAGFDTPLNSRNGQARSSGRTGEGSATENGHE